MSTYSNTSLIKHAHMPNNLSIIYIYWESGKISVWNAIQAEGQKCFLDIQMALNIKNRHGSKLLHGIRNIFIEKEIMNIFVTQMLNQVSHM